MEWLVTIIVIAKNLRFEINNNGRLKGGDAFSFRQGDLDEACGLHAAMTALTVSGVASHENINKVWRKRPDGRTKFARWLKEIPPLVQGGTSGSEVVNLLTSFETVIKSKVKLNPYICNDSDKNDEPVVKGRKLMACIIKKIDEGYPSIIWLDWKGGGSHWAVAVGYEKEDKTEEIRHLLVIDPGAEISRIQLWNAILSFRPHKSGPRPFHYCLGCHEISDSSCQISNAILVNP